MKSSIRRGTMEDVEVIAQLLVDVQQLHADALPHFFKQPQADGFPPEMVRKMMEEPDNVILLAEEHEGTTPPTVVGYLLAVVKSTDENPFAYARKACHIEHLSVRPDRQGAGHGARLMRAARAYAAEQDATMITLDVWDFNKKAQRFFQSQGYVPARHRMVIWAEAGAESTE